MQDIPPILLAGGASELEQLKSCFQELGCDVLSITDTREAPSYCKSHKAALVVLATGDDEAGLLGAVQALRQGDHSPEPVVILFERERDQGLRARFLDAGGNDFFNAVSDSLVMNVRMESYLRLAKGLDCQQQLDYQQGIVEVEKLVAQSVVKTVLHSDALQKMEHLRWSLSANALFNGDLILAANSPDGKLNLLMGHFSGHGLAAAIGALPTAEIFYAMTAKGFEIVEILLEINKRLTNLLPTEIFLSACLVEIDAPQRTAHVWNGGMPDLLHYNAASGELDELVSRHPPLSALDNDELDRSMALLTLQQDDRLFIYSNSLLKALAASRREQGETGLAGLLGPGLPRSLDELEYYLTNSQEAGEQAISLLEFQVDQSVRDWSDSGGQALYGHGNRAEWRYQIIMEPEILREFDPRPMLTQLMVEVQGLQDHRERLYTIIAELFSNALEHGVLGLDSGLKSSPEGFGRYYMQREERLAELEDGRVHFSLGHQPTEQGGILSIEVEDTGDGFDFESDGYGALKSEGYCGRGIGLIRQMAEEVVYFSPGNRVKISYHWNKS